MSKTIPGVPESVTREQYQSLIEGVGLHPRRTKELRFTRQGIFATVVALDTESHVVFQDDAPPAMHEIFIPVVDTKSEGA